MAIKFSKAYLAAERAEYRKGGKEVTAHEKKESKKKELAERKALGSRVMGPDMQEKTGTMGKQPVSVYARLRGKR